MRDAPALHLLFATNFSDACYRTASAVGQLAGRCPLTLTIVHAVRPDDPVLDRRRQLDAFMADADLDVDCRRLIIEGRDPAGDVAELCATRRFDLVMAPGAPRHAWRGLPAPSFRSHLLTRCGVPLWTAGACLASTDFARPIGTVSCLLDFDDDPASFLRLVSAFSRRLAARLRVLAVIAPVDDGTLAEVLTSDAPLTPTRAAERIQELCAGQELPSIDVALGERGREVRRMLGHNPADLLFVGRRHAAGPRFLQHTLDRLPCPVVCVDGRPMAFARWSFQDQPHPLRYPSLDDAVIAGG